MSQPIKVMHIIARLNIGGAAAYVILMVDKLRDCGAEAILVCGQVGEQEGDMQYLADEHNVQPIILPELGREISPIRDLKTLRRLFRLIRQQKPDVVHTHTAKAGFLGRLAAWIARVPVRIHTHHGHAFYGYFSPLKAKAILILERLCSKISTRIVAVSEAQTRDLAQVYRVAPQEKFVTLIYGFDLKPLTEAPPQGKVDDFIDQHRLPRDKKRIGIVGRLVPIKNHELFLKAAQVIAQRRSDVHFVVAGDGELRTDLEVLTRKLGLEHCVTFTGWVRDVKTAMYSLDVMALTSKNEGTPVSIIEGMAAGLPVVSTDVGGVADILNHGELGYIVPPSDWHALAKSLLLILDGELPDAKRAQTVALKRFDATYRAQELIDLYRKLLRASFRSPSR